MDNFLDRYQIPKLNQDQIDHLKSPIAPKEIEEVIESLPTKKRTGPDGFSAEFYQTFKEDLTAILFKLFHKIETERTLPNSFYKTTIMLIPNHTKIQQRRTTGQYPFLISIYKYSIKFLPTESKNTSK